MDYEKIFYQKTKTNRCVEWAYYQAGTAGSFVKALCRAYELGDLQNRRRLELAFPYLFGAAREWYYCDDPDQYLKELIEVEDNSETEIKEI